MRVSGNWGKGPLNSTWKKVCFYYLQCDYASMIVLRLIFLILFDHKSYVFKKLELEENKEKASFRNIICIHLENCKYSKTCCFHLRCEYQKHKRRTNLVKFNLFNEGQTFVLQNI